MFLVRACTILCDGRRMSGRCLGVFVQLRCVVGKLVIHLWRSARTSKFCPYIKRGLVCASILIRMVLWSSVRAQTVGFVGESAAHRACMRILARASCCVLTVLLGLVATELSPVSRGSSADVGAPGLLQAWANHLEGFLHRVEGLVGRIVVQCSVGRSSHLVFRLDICWCFGRACGASVGMPSRLPLGNASSVTAIRSGYSGVSLTANFIG